MENVLRNVSLAKQTSCFVTLAYRRRNCSLDPVFFFGIFCFDLFIRQHTFVCYVTQTHVRAHRTHTNDEPHIVACLWHAIWKSTFGTAASYTFIRSARIFIYFITVCVLESTVRVLCFFFCVYSVRIEFDPLWNAFISMNMWSKKRVFSRKTLS